MGLLTAANVLAYSDRQLLALLLEPVRLDFGRSDVEMGFLYGTCFALIYAIAGVPFLVAAHRWHRPRLIAVAIASWSLMTAASGLAGGFLTLVLLRVGVGMSEAGLAPTALSLLTERVGRRQLATATGVFVSANYIGNGASSFFGGLLANTLHPNATLWSPVFGWIRGWQLIFILIAVPGLLLAGIFAFMQDGISVRPKRAAGYARALLREVRSKFSGYAAASFAFGLMALVGSQANAWIPTLLARRFGWSTAKIGVSFGLVTLCAGTLGAILAGRVISAVRARGGTALRSNMPVTCLMILVPLTIAYPFAPSGEALLLMDGVMLFFAAASLSSGYAIASEMPPSHFSGTVSAVFVLMLSLIGPGLGPVAGPLANRFLFNTSGQLPLAMAVVGAVGSTLSVLCFIFLRLRWDRSVV